MDQQNQFADRQVLQDPHATASYAPTPGDDGGTPLSPGWLRPSEPVARPALPGFTILDELGRGGMGIVYLARQENLGRRVALKIGRPGAQATPEHLRLLQSEAGAAACLSHPNIVQIYDVGAHDGVPYFSMEYVEGKSLSDALAGDELAPVRDVVQIVALVADAVHAAHRRGIIHGDLKPSNILLTPSGVPKITDFGLARRVEVPKSPSGSEWIAGSPSYMAPEQARGDSNAVGVVTDVYGLGAVLYFALVGRPPFLGDSPIQTILQIRSPRDEVVQPRKLRRQLPKDLERICMKCLEKDPARRYGSARAVAEDLRRFVRGEPVRARPVGPLGRCGKWARRNPVVAALTLLVAFLVVGGFAAVASQWWRAERARQAAAALAVAEAKAREASDATREQAETARTEAEAHLYDYRLLLAGRAWEDARLDRVEDILGECPEALRHWEWRYLRGRCATEQFVFRAHQGPVMELAVTPDGVLCCSAALGERAVVVWRLLTGEERWALAATEVSPVRAVAIHPAGTEVALAGDDGTVAVRELASGNNLGVFPSRGAPVYGLAYAPDGAQLAVGDLGGQVTLFDRRGGKSLRTFPAASGGVLALAFNHAGTRLAASCTDGRIRVWDLRTGAEDPLRREHEGPVRGLAFHPEANLLASGGDDGTIRLWEEAPAAARILRAHGGAVTSVAFSADGGRLYSGGADRQVVVWDVAQGRALFTLRGHRGPITSLASLGADRVVAGGEDTTVRRWGTGEPTEALTWTAHQGQANAISYHPGGGILASGGNDTVVRLWSLQPFREDQTLRGHAGPITAVAFHPNGLLLASASEDRTARLWSTRTGATERVLAGHEAGLTCLAVSPGGRRIATGGRDRTVRLWETTTGALLRTCRGHAGTVRSVIFSASGDRLVSAGDDGTLRRWDVATGKELAVGRGHSGIVWCLGNVQPGDLLFSGGYDGTIRLWPDTAAAGASSQLLRGHEGAVTGIAVSPDGRRLASGGADQTLRVWNRETGRELLTLPLANARVTSVVFSPDGTHLAVARSDGAVTLY